MKWLKRSLWLAAWGLWLYLCVGLYRELPRSLGAPVCRLPVNGVDSWPLTFIGDTNEVVVYEKTRPHPDEKHWHTRVRVVNAESGAVVREGEGPLTPEGWVGNPLLQCRRGLLFARLLPHEDGVRIKRGVYVLDLKTMAWRLVSRRQPRTLSLHPTKPLIAFASDGRDRLSDPTVPWGAAVVVNYDTEQETVLKEFTHGIFTGVDFLADGDRVAVATIRNDDRNSAANSPLDIWRFDPQPARERLIEIDGAVFWGDWTTNSRVLVWTSSKLGTINVYDFASNRYLLSQGGDNWHPATVSSNRGAPGLSADGRRLLSGDPTAVWDVDSGNSIWRPTTCEVASCGDRGECFLVHEYWHHFWDQWISGFNLETLACRRLHDGRLIHRTSPANELLPIRRNLAGALVIGGDGAVYALPLAVNYPLLALCQLILALPLVLLWLVLIWRRRRAARRQPAEAPQ